MTWRRAAGVVLFVVLHCWVVANVVLLSRDMMAGDRSGEAIRPQPRWGFMRVPATAATERFQAGNRLAADFAQVYFPSRSAARLADAYTSGTPDPWARPSRYPPFVHALCAVSLCRLSYGPASVVHLLVQLLLFHVSFIYAFKVLRVERYLWGGILLVNVALFLTPVGLSWYERGQFSLYVALGYLWLVLGLLRRNVLHLVLAAVFTCVKLTAAPFVAVAMALWILGSTGRADLRARVRLALAFASAVVLLLVGHYPSGIPFLAGLLDQEAHYLPFGVSLTLLVPKYVVKLAPLALVVVGCVHLRTFARDYTMLVPCLTGAAILLITYPTWAFDYGVSSVLAFVPLLIYWSRRPEIEGHALGRILVGLLPAFILLASFAQSATARLRWPESVQIHGYLLGAAAFLFLPLFIRRPAPPPSGARGVPDRVVVA